MHIKITINGKEKEFPRNILLQELIQEFYKPSTLAIAELNGEIIKKNRWNEVAIKHGDSLELVSFVGGG
jgi:sulfur carrier protein